MTTTSSVEVSYSVTSAGTMVPSEKGDWKIFIMMKMLRSPFQPKGLKWVENKETETFKVTCERFEFFETAELDTFLIANNWERLGQSHHPTPGWIFLNLVPGIGTGVLFAGIDIAIPAAADTIDMGYAIAFLTFFRTFGQSIGVAVGGCIFQNALQKEMQAYPILAPFAAKFSQDAMGLVQMIKLMDGGLAKTQLIQAYADSIKTLWLPMCGMAIVGLLSNFMVKQFISDVEHRTEQGFKNSGKVMGTEL